MSAQPDCPVSEVWQTLFEDDLPPEQEALYERHLESCTLCQDHLDRMADLPDPLRRVRDRIGDPTLVPCDPTVSQLLARLVKAGKPDVPRVAADDLFFLRPADQPGVLGLLDGYQVQEVIGRGGMGLVLKAFEPALNR